MRKMTVILAAFVVLWPSSAFAYDWYTVAEVAAVEGTAAPSIVRFWVTTKVGSCPVGQEFGSQLDYRPNGGTPDEKIANGQTVAAILMTAKTGGRKIKIFGRNSDCVVEYIYLL